MPTYVGGSPVTPSVDFFNQYRARTYTPADLDALATLSPAPDPGDIAIVAEGGAQFVYATGGWRQTTVAVFATATARDTAYAKASGVYRVGGVARVRVTAENITRVYAAAGWYRPAGSTTRRERVTALDVTTSVALLDYSGAVTTPSPVDVTYSAGTFTVVRRGTYLINARLGMKTAGAAVGHFIRLRVNSTVRAVGNNVTSTSGGNYTEATSAITLEAGDTFDVQVYASTGVGADVTAGATFIEITFQGE